MSALPDTNTTRKVLKYLYPPGAVIELRSMQSGRVLSGYFKDHEALIAAAIEANRNNSVYMCLNPCPQDLYARCADKLRQTKKGQATADKDIECRLHLLIDIDVVRPVGISSTDAQKQEACNVMGRVWEYIVRELNLPAPPVMDSGNGYHMLLALDRWPNTPENLSLCKAFLQHLSGKFSSDQVKIDVGMANAARIVQCYGFVNRKGDDLPDYPHRTTGILHMPTTADRAMVGQVADRATVDQVAAAIGWRQAEAAQAPEPKPAGVYNYGTPLSEIFDDCGLEYSVGERETESGEVAASYRIDCPWGGPGHADDAFALQWPSGNVYAGCSHDSCQHKTTNDFFAALGVRVREAYTQFQGFQDENRAPPKPPCLGLVTKRFSDIEHKDIQWLWKNRLPFGKLTLLAGAGSGGKTFVICHIAAQLSIGGRFPCGSKAPLAETLIINAEDDEEDTIKPRLAAAGADQSKIHWLYGVGPEKRLFHIKRHIDELDAYLEANPDIRLIVLDPITAFMDGSDGNSNSEVRSVLFPLSQLARTRKVAILGISHVGKSAAQKARDDRMLGSVAFSNAARAVWHLDRDKEQEGRRLFQPGKSNYILDPGYAFRIVKDAVKWESEPLPYESSAEEPEQTKGKVQQAEEWLVSYMELPDSPYPLGYIYEAAVKAGINKRTLRKAASNIGVLKDDRFWTRPANPTE